MVDITFNLKNFEFFLLILVRIASFVVSAPFFGMSGIPNRIKIMVAAVVTVMMYYVVEFPTLEYESVIGYAVIVVQETVTGLLIGYAANICNSIINFAGAIIDMDIGFSMASEFNPALNAETTISGNFYYYLVMLILIGSNMHAYILRAVCDSFSVIPIGGTILNPAGLLAMITRYMLNLCVIGFRIFLPYFACIMVVNVILGIMAKVAPQMNMFAIGIQIKILAGMVVMYLTIFMMPSVADYIFREIKEMVVLAIENMR